MGLGGTLGLNLAPNSAVAWPLLVMLRCRYRASHYIVIICVIISHISCNLFLLLQMFPCRVI